VGIKVTDLQGDVKFLAGLFWKLAKIGDFLKRWQPVGDPLKKVFDRITG